MELSLYLEQFLESLKSQNYSPKTINTYRYPLGKFLSFLAENNIQTLPEVTENDLKKYQHSLRQNNFTEETINTYIGGVRKFFKFLENEGVIFSNPATILKTPSIKTPIRDVPSEEDIKRFNQQIDTSNSLGIRNRALIETAYCCGLRCNELLSLTLLSVDLKNKVLRVFGKGQKERVIPLGKHAITWLKKYISTGRLELTDDPNNYALWISRNGAQMQSVTYQNMLHLYSEKAQLKKRISGHTLRRACATHMLLNGAHPVTIQHLLGHRDLNTLHRNLKININALIDTHKNSILGA